jgi:outer membrane receptor for ferrienterochelin and colicins
MRNGSARTALVGVACLMSAMKGLTARADGLDVEPGAGIDILDLPSLPEPGGDVVDPTALLAAAATGEDLVTGAAKREQSLGNVASAVTVISGDRLRRMGARTLGEAIATAAGVHLVDDRLSTRVNIRGIQPLGDFNTRILVIIDGTSVTESWSHLSGVGYDVAVSIDEVERIEVIRGPVSSIYGTNAFFGIINVITRGPSEEGRAWGRVSGGSISGGSVAAGFAVGTVDRQLRGEISANERRGETLDYLLTDSGPDGLKLYPRQKRSFDAGRQLQASLSGVSRGTFAQLRGYIYDRTIPFGPYGVSPLTPYEQSNRQLLADVGHSLEVDGLQLRGRVFGSLYRFNDRATDTPDNSDTPESVRVIGRARTIGAEVRGRYQVREALLGVTAGLEASYNDTVSGAGEKGDEEAGSLTFGLAGLYAEADSEPTKWLSLTAGVRLDGNTEFGVGLSPRLAAFFSRGNRHGLKLLYAEGFRYPSTYEAIFYDNVDFKNNEDDPDPEKIRSVEAVLWGRPTPTTWLRASVFHWTAEKIIKQVIDPDTNLLYFDNQARNTSYGLELEASYRDRRGWLAFAGAALTHVRAQGSPGETETRLEGAPAVTASFGVSSPRLMKLLHISTELSVIGERTTRAVDDVGARAAVFAGWNAALYAPSLRGFDLTIGVKNLLDQIQQVPAAEDFDRDQVASTVFGEGRELYVRLGYALR